MYSIVSWAEHYTITGNRVSTPNPYSCGMKLLWILLRRVQASVDYVLQIKFCVAAASVGQLPACLPAV